MRPPRIEAARATTVWSGGRELLYFGGCDYLGLAHEGRVLAALGEEAARSGLSAGAARATSGTHREHLLLEEELARFAGREAALLLGEGALANFALAEALARRARRAIVDERAHVTGKRALRAAGFAPLEHRHADARHAAALARERAGEGVALWTDGAHPALGTLAPLADLVRALPGERATLVVDDAHAFGLLGARGAGTTESLGIAEQRLVLTITLSKTLGCYGGAILGTRELVEEVRKASDTFAGTTPIPPAIARAARRALGIVESEPERRARSARNRARMAKLLGELGLVEREPALPVFRIALAPGRVERVARGLLAEGIFVPLTDYPGDGGPALRLVVSSEHADAELDALARALARTLAPSTL